MTAVRVHHVESGRPDGPAVVLAGSLGSTLEMWDAQVARLAERFRVVRVDHPGHGGSPRAAFDGMAGLAREVLAAAGAASFSFVGLSLGAAVGLQLALDVPDRLERLVVASAAPRFATRESWHERANTVRERGLEAIVDATMERWFTPDFDDVQRFREMFLSTDAEGYARCCDALRDWDVGGRLDGVRVPTLAIAAADDPSTPPDRVSAIAGEIPGARLAEVPDARHLVNVERPDVFNALLLEHLG